MSCSDDNDTDRFKTDSRCDAGIMITIIKNVEAKREQECDNKIKTIANEADRFVVFNRAAAVISTATLVYFIELTVLIIVIQMLSSRCAEPDKS